tara:strand:- start:75 stop:590 length:516 start_codon:yes stop_codon:yes gene_type:complete
MDLKNIDLKNIKLDELISKVKTIEKKVLIKIGIGVGSVIFFLIIYYAVLNPIVEKKKVQLEDMNVKKTEITKFTNEIISIKKKIKKVKPEYENYSTLFHSKAEVEGLYQTLSEYASLNGLVISKISKGKPLAITKASLSKKKKKKKSKKRRRKKVSLITRYPLVMKLKGIF